MLPRVQATPKQICLACSCHHSSIPLSRPVEFVQALVKNRRLEPLKKQKKRTTYMFGVIGQPQNEVLDCHCTEKVATNINHGLR